MDHWRTYTLEEIVINKGLVRGPFGGALKKEFFVSDGYKVYEQKNAIYGTVDLGNYFIDEVKYNELKRFAVKPGDFIVSCSGTIGKIFQIPPDAPSGVINQALLKITLDETIVDPLYFYYYFTWPRFQSAITDRTQGGAIQNLVGMDSFKKTKIILPELKQQKKAAAILETCDLYLDAIDQIISCKRNIKKGILQQYFNVGKNESDAKSVKLAEVVRQFTTGLNPRNNFKLGIGNNRYITIKNIHDGRLDLRTYDTVDDEALKMIAKRSRLEVDDVIMASIGNVGDAYLVEEPPLNWNINESVFNIKPNKSKVTPHYLYYTLTSPHAKKFFENNITGSSFKSIKMKDLREMPILLRKLEEQEEIVNVLKNLDLQIAALARKVTLIKEQKHYLMNYFTSGMFENTISQQVTIAETTYA
jgi:type I restriction enzyme S subunit